MPPATMFGTEAHRAPSGAPGRFGSVAGFHFEYTRIAAYAAYLLGYPRLLPVLCFEPPEEDCGNIALVVAPIGLTVSDVLSSVVFPVSWLECCSAALKHT